MAEFSGAYWGGGRFASSKRSTRRKKNGLLTPRWRGPTNPANLFGLNFLFPTVVRRSEMKSLGFSPAFARLDLLTNGVVLTKIDGQFRTYFCQYKGPMLSNCDVSICSICFCPISHVSIFRLLYAELEVRGLRTFGSYHIVHTHL